MKLEEWVVLLMRVTTWVARCGAAHTPWQYVTQSCPERHVMTVLHIAGSVPDAAISNVVEIEPLPDGTVTAADEAVDSPIARGDGGAGWSTRRSAGLYSPAPSCLRSEAVTTLSYDPLLLNRHRYFGT